MDRIGKEGSSGRHGTINQTLIQAWFQGFSIVTQAAGYPVIAVSGSISLAAHKAQRLHLAVST